MDTTCPGRERRLGTQRSSGEGKCNVTAVLTPRDTWIAAKPALWTPLWAPKENMHPPPPLPSFSPYSSVLKTLIRTASPLPSQCPDRAGYCVVIVHPLLPAVIDVLPVQTAPLSRLEQSSVTLWWPYMPVRGAYQKLPLIAPLRWLTLPLSEWLVAAL